MTDISKVAEAITDTEAEIMQQLWLKSPLSGQEIIKGLQAHPSTVKTLINRLLKKGALLYEEKDRRFMYSPSISQREFLHHKTKTFIDQFCDGEVSPLVSYFSNCKKLSDNELAELKQLIAKVESEGVSDDD